MTSVHADHEHGTAHSHARLHHASSDSAVDAALAVLRARGERVTSARRSVLGVLAATAEHVSADQVVALLESSDPGVHRATVYRTLDVLTELGIVSHMHASGGATVYHLAATPIGHEHLHGRCRVCGEVVVLPADALDEASARVAGATGFRLEPAQSTLSGVCASCARAGYAG